MSIQSVLLPVLIQVGLVFVLLGFMAKARMDALNGGLRLRDIALSGDAFPVRARQIANCYSNQFEMPVLFLLAVIFGIVLHHTGWLFVFCEWLFVVCRIGHAVVHTTTNRVMLRGPIFLGSAIATALMWVLIFVGVFFGGSYS
jgi:hypothetical protein